MKKRNKKHIGEVIVVVSMFFLLFFICLIDLIYNDYFFCSPLWEIVCWLEKVLMCLGFERKIALDLMKSSLGLIITMFTFVLNTGISIFNRFERKIYGIPYGDLCRQKSSIRRMSYIISLVLPILIIIAINLELCGMSYLLLLYSYILVIYNYGIYGGSYDKEGLRKDAVNTLIACVDKDDLADDQITEFAAIIDEIRREVHQSREWNNIWLLLDELIERIMYFDDEKSYFLACHVWEIFLADNEDRNIQISVIYTKRYIERIGRSILKYERELIIVWSLLCSAISQWNPKTLESFLEWFAEIANLGNYRSLVKEAGMVLLMLEYWFCARTDNVVIDYVSVQKIYEHGREIFLEEKDYIMTLANLYKVQYGDESWEPCNEAQILCRDIKYDLNNSLLRTELDL